MTNQGRRSAGETSALKELIFTHPEHAFRHKNIAGIVGRRLLIGYIGTLALGTNTAGHSRQGERTSIID